MRPRPASPLRVHRTAAGLTQGELASIAGLCKETVCNVETGSTVPARRTAKSLAAALGVDILELFPPGL